MYKLYGDSHNDEEQETFIVRIGIRECDIKLICGSKMRVD